MQIFANCSGSTAFVIAAPIPIAKRCQLGRRAWPLFSCELHEAWNKMARSRAIEDAGRLRYHGQQCVRSSGISPTISEHVRSMADAAGASYFIHVFLRGTCQHQKVLQPRHLRTASCWSRSGERRDISGLNDGDFSMILWNAKIAGQGMSNHDHQDIRAGPDQSRSTTLYNFKAFFGSPSKARSTIRVQAELARIAWRQAEPRTC